jgi:hypothetical protein
LRNPAEYLNDLNPLELEALQKDIAEIITLEKNEDICNFWKALLVLCENDICKNQPQTIRTGSFI